MGLRNNILKRIEEIKKTEFGFADEWWSNCYVNFHNNKKKTTRLSELSFKELNDEQLVRCFEYIIKQQQDAISYRIKRDYEL